MRTADKLLAIIIAGLFLVMFLNRGGFGLGAGPTGAYINAGYQRAAG